MDFRIFGALEVVDNDLMQTENEELFLVGNGITPSWRPDVR